MISVVNTLIRMASRSSAFPAPDAFSKADIFSDTFLKLVVPSFCSSLQNRASSFADADSQLFFFCMHSSIFAVVVKYALFPPLDPPLRDPVGCVKKSLGIIKSPFVVLFYMMLYHTSTCYIFNIVGMVLAPHTAITVSGWPAVSR